MKLRILSDLHLEFQNMELEVLPDEDRTILVLAGDIHVGNRAKTFIDNLLHRFDRVVYVLGNHEFYDNEMDDVITFWEEYEADQGLDGNFYFLNNNYIRFKDIDGKWWMLWGGTMWTPMAGNVKDATEQWRIRQQLRQNMTDFQIIYRDGKRVTPHQLQNLHEVAKEKLKMDLANYALDNKIIVTHHLPTQEMVEAKYRNEKTMNHAYVANLDDVIEKFKPNLWIFGHTHETVFKHIGDTYYVCNPRGYAGYATNPQFDPNLVLDVEMFKP